MILNLLYHFTLNKVIFIKTGLNLNKKCNIWFLSIQQGFLHISTKILIYNLSSILKYEMICNWQKFYIRDITSIWRFKKYAILSKLQINQYSIEDISCGRSNIPSRITKCWIIVFSRTRITFLGIILTDWSTSPSENRRSFFVKNKI